MSASVLDRLKWSETDYDMKEFVEFYGDSLPMLCMTTSGYSGCDEDIHQVAADEIIWIHSILRQTRIVAKDKQKRYISIPVDNCPFKFQLIEDDNKKRSLVTAADLLTSFQQNSSARIRFQFEKDQTVSYQIGADIGNVARFGIMELKEFYDEKYLLGFGMHSGYLYVRTVGIPVYMDVSLARATGFESEKENGATFRRWMDELRKVIDSLEKTTINTCQGVIVFPERPTNGDYEYMRPPNFLSDTSKKPDKMQTQSDINKPENEYACIRTFDQSLEPETVEVTLETLPTTGKTPEGRKSRVEEIIRVPLPQIPRRAPPIPREVMEDTSQRERAPAPLPTRADGNTPPAIPSRKPGSGPKTNTNRKGSKPRSADENNPVYHVGEYYNIVPPPPPPLPPPLPPPPPSVHQPLSYEMTIPGTARSQCYTSLANLHSDHPSQMDPSECSTLDPFDVDSPEDDPASASPSRHGDRIGLSTEDSFDESPPPIPPLPQKWTHPVAKTTTQDDVTYGGSRLARYVTASEVPPGEDAENWTIGDVTEALRLLKMSEHSDLFKEREIDGSLLCSLDEKTLVEDFGFKLFEATKFFMFVRKGWRPK